ncbi:LysR family transcriptional regulator [Actinomadura viridis]|uniref:DNA-binding transcriptional LysR family regulator n=1 Tax=Actinomadura viridis TaxID=58110 RepID=A0A931DTP3_9ACTN|nr:LysR family transcriptional regulator [Actinomadura viridis]MBG6093345.1 DNA-binding transcriptional LysR family regulator [Actinomadura viridis]
MELHLLRAFEAVARHGHYGRAARELALTQPALSKQIQSLEARAGGRLFDRGRHGAALTPLGTLLLPEARTLLRRADDLAGRMVRMARGEVGRMAVGFGLSSIQTAPRAVAAFRARYPDTAITLEDMSSSVQLDLLKSGELDVGFVRLPAGDGWGRLPVGGDRLALASTDPAARLEDGPFVGLARAKGPGLVDQVERYCAALGVRARPVQEAHDLQTVLALVAAGVGMALVPSEAAAIAPPPVTVTPIDHPAARWRIGAVWNPAFANAVTGRFIAVVEELTSASRAPENAVP